MRLAIFAAIVALLIGLGAGYLLRGERTPRATEESDVTRMRQAQQADAFDALQRQADELRRLKEELASERERRQRLEEVISKGRK
jgi:hypothetical protein